MKSIAIFIPGAGYHKDKPLLYYSSRMFAQLGFETFCVEFENMPKKKVAGDLEMMKEMVETGYRQTEKALKAYDFTQYDIVYLVGKSIGTVIAARYAAEHNLDAKLVLYTPLEATFIYDIRNAQAYIGTNDPWSELENIIRMSAERNIPLYQYEGCNHSLETEDALKNIEVLSDVINKTREYLLSDY